MERILSLLWPYCACFGLYPALFILLPAGRHTLPITPAPAEKYIFYWGTAQCDLTAANGFKSQMSVSQAEFKQMLLNPPKIWDGKTLLRDFSFKLGGMRITTADYVSRIGQLDETFGQNVVPGQLLRLTELQLDARTEGSIDITIQESAPKKENAARNVWQSAPASYLNSRWLERVIWGREEVYDTPNRDFFTAAEFWQTVQQLPVLEWKKHANPVPVSVSIQFADPGSTTFGLVARLDDESYKSMLANLENYRHLVKPGATISLILKTAEQHEELFQRRMVLVPDNDPRLALRRNRDTHTLRFRWGAWTDQVEFLYLRRLPDASGNPYPVDLPVGRAAGRPRAEVLEMLHLRPELWIDGQPVPAFFYRLSSDSASVRIPSGATVPEDFGKDIYSGTRERGVIQLDSFEVAGYDLPPITLFLNYFDIGNRLLVRNDFDALNAVQGSVRIKLLAPVFEKTDLSIDFSVPEQVKIALSIFEPDGRNVFLQEETYPAGQHTLKVPRSAFRRGGKHFCFLNTPFGVAKQEFEVKGE